MSFIGSSPQIQETLDLLYAGYKTQTPTILWGPPGVGKTELVRNLARREGLPLFILLASTMDPTDINGLPAIKELKIERPVVRMLPELDNEGKPVLDEEGKPVLVATDDIDIETATVTEPTLQYWSEALIREGKGILFFDEANNAVPSVQSTLLSVLQGRIVGRHTLPDDVWMIAAANETADAADAWDLSAPMANRFAHIEFTPSFSDWCEGMSCGWNSATPKGLETDKLQASRSTVVQFLKQRGETAWNQIPSDAASRSKAWPSPRSWDNAARMLAAIPSDRLTSRYLAVKGLVGEGLAHDFQTFEEGLRLPDYEVVLNTPDKINWDDLTAGEVQIILDMLMANLDDETALKTIEAFNVISSNAGKVDLIAAAVLTLHKKIGPFLRRRVVHPRHLLELSTKYAGFLNEAGIK